MPNTSFFNERFFPIVQEAIKKMKSPFSTIELIREQWGSYHNDHCEANKSINANIGIFLSDNAKALNIEKKESKSLKDDNGKETTSAIWEKTISLVTMLSATMFFSCSSSDKEPTPPDASSSSLFSEYTDMSSSSSIQSGQSSSSATPEYGYCVYPETQLCILSIGTLATCPSGGILSNACPYNSVSSSSSAILSSSSFLAESSSSNVATLSSSSTTSGNSSSNGCIGSGSYCNYGGCQEWSSDGLSCSLSVNGRANEGGCYPMPTGDYCNNGTLVSACHVSTIPPSSNYCEVSTAEPSSSSLFIANGKFTDSRDGQIYNTVTIGTITWMAQNLNYDAEGSECYDNSTAYCQKYGRLYNWETAMNVCPSGWYLPSKNTWEDSLGLDKFYSIDLIATDYGGNDKYGFAALLYNSSTFPSARWWTATTCVGACTFRAAYWWDISSYYGDSEKAGLLSVRCIQ